MKRRHPSGRIHFLIIALIGFSIATYVQFTKADGSVFFAAYCVALLLLSGWAPIMVAPAQDLVVPRLRGVGFAVQTVATSLIGLGLGPYLVGFISDATGDLRLAVLSLLLLMPVLLGVLWPLAIVLPADESSIATHAETSAS